MGILTLISNALGWLTGWNKFQTVKQERDNAPDMVANKNAEQTHAVAEKTQKDLQSANLSELRKDLAE